MTTPVPEVLPHVQAILDAIGTLPGVPLPAYVGGAPPGPGALPATYAVLYPDAGTVAPASLADERTELDAIVQITCCGNTPAGAIGTRDRVARALADPLAVNGRACWTPECIGGPPLQRDDDLTPPVWYLPVQYRIRSIPA